MKSELLDFHNAGFLSMAELDKSANPVHLEDILTPSAGKNKTQSREEVDKASKYIVKYAKEAGKPVVKEKLSFMKKRAKLKPARSKKGKSYNRMLTTFNESQFDKSLERRCEKEGVELIRVNPAFTSVAGKQMCQQRKISVHKAAACCIGRRGMGFSIRRKKSDKQKEAEKKQKQAIRERARAKNKAEKEFQKRLEKADPIQKEKLLQQKGEERMLCKATKELKNLITKMRKTQRRILQQFKPDKTEEEKQEGEIEIQVISPEKAPFRQAVLINPQNQSFDTAVLHEGARTNASLIRDFYDAVRTPVVGKPKKKSSAKSAPGKKSASNANKKPNETNPDDKTSDPEDR